MTVRILNVLVCVFYLAWSAIIAFSVRTENFVTSYHFTPSSNFILGTYVAYIIPMVLVAILVLKEIIKQSKNWFFYLGLAVVSIMQGLSPIIQLKISSIDFSHDLGHLIFYFLESCNCYVTGITASGGWIIGILYILLSINFYKIQSKNKSQHGVPVNET